MPANEAIVYYRPGQDITGHANVALTGKRCVAIVGNRQSGPGLSATGEGGNYLIGLPTAAQKVFGVAAHDAAQGTKVNVIRGGVVPITASAAITAFQEVEVLGDGRVAPLSTGKPIGICCTGAASGADAEIALY